MEQEILKRFESLEDRIKKLEQAIVLSTTPEIDVRKGKKLSAKEFLMTKPANTDTKRALVLAYFLEHFEGMQSFNAPDLVAAFRAAKATVAKNMNATVDKNIAQGYMMDAKEKKNSKKAWCMTATGEKYVENDLSNRKG